MGGWTCGDVSLGLQVSSLHRVARDRQGWSPRLLLGSGDSQSHPTLTESKTDDTNASLVLPVFPAMLSLLAAAQGALTSKRVACSGQLTLKMPEGL